jgi:hypothetical protein
VAKVVAIGPALLVEAILVSSGEEVGWEATSMVASPTVSDLLRAIPDTPDTTQGLGAMSVEEVG